MKSKKGYFHDFTIYLYVYMYLIKKSDNDNNANRALHCNLNGMIPEIMMKLQIWGG